MSHAFYERWDTLLRRSIYCAPHKISLTSRGLRPI